MRVLSRREALATVAAVSTAASVSGAADTESMPVVHWGQHTISRLIVGGNPVSGNSHLSPELSAEMRDYFTAANIKKMLAECESAGINTWQSRADHHIMRLLNEYRLEGGRIQWIAQSASEYGDFRRNLGEMAALKPIGVYHHGSMTDTYWSQGKIDQVSDLLKAIRQTGAQVGLGTHRPEVVDYVESKGWDLDFYMTCVYQIEVRTREEAEKIAGRKLEGAPGDFFWDPDREKMLERVHKTTKPCLIFKVYGASRNCATTESKAAALQLAFRYAKPSDAVVIGMFPKHQEQVRENCQLVKQAIQMQRR
jgi:hypothetical protein